MRTWHEAEGDVVFTGLVEALGTFEGREGTLYTFSWPDAEEAFKDGESIAVNGCCLTVVESAGGRWSANVVDETLAKTNLGLLNPGEPVNLERPLRVCDRLGGHIVQGHVDSVGTVVEPAPPLRVRFAPEFAKYVVEKGSISIDGVSLTVVEAGRDFVSVALIPHTALVTTLGVRKVGDSVNLEFDIVAKYVLRMNDLSASRDNRHSEQLS